jgi:hypothetical protein
MKWLKGIHKNWDKKLTGNKIFVTWNQFGCAVPKSTLLWIYNKYNVQHKIQLDIGSAYYINHKYCVLQ